MYYEAKAVDPMGILTREGKMEDFGAIMISDYNMKSLMNTALDEEDKKSLFQTEERGSVKARYHTVVLPMHMPRTFSCNADNDSGGHVDAGAYFEWNDMQGLAAVARKTLTRLGHREMHRLQLPAGALSSLSLRDSTWQLTIRPRRPNCRPL